VIGQYGSITGAGTVDVVVGGSVVEVVVGGSVVVVVVGSGSEVVVVAGTEARVVVLGATVAGTADVFGGAAELEAAHCASTHNAAAVAASCVMARVQRGTRGQATGVFPASA
jgi:hypothetical protein